LILGCWALPSDYAGTGFGRTDLSHPWAGVPSREDSKKMALFMTPIHITVGDPRSSLFWIDPWLDGHRISDIAPDLVVAVPTRIQKTRTVATALLDNAWCGDIRGSLMVQVII
jgi:hypothetical protein